MARDVDKMLRAGLVNRVRRSLANLEFHLAGMHDQKSHGNWAGDGMEGDSVEEQNAAYRDMIARRKAGLAGKGAGVGAGVAEFTSVFDGAFDPHNLMDGNAKIQKAGSLALDVVSSIHGIEAGYPKAIALIDNGEWLGEDGGNLGAYMPPDSESERGRLVLRASGNVGDMATTMVHELGHHLTIGDVNGVEKFHEQLRKPGSELNLLYTAIRDTDTFKDLASIKTAMENDEGASEDQKGFVSYLMMPEELVARSYAQYIAVKSGNREMLGSIDRVLRDENTDIMQWQKSEFEGLVPFWDRYLASRGLMKA